MGPRIRRHPEGRVMPRADRYAWALLTLEFTGAVAFIAIVCAPLLGV